MVALRWRMRVRVLFWSYSNIFYHSLECLQTDLNDTTHPDAMNLTVKTLKGGKFTIEVDPSNTVAQVKEAIVS